MCFSSWVTPARWWTCCWRRKRGRRSSATTTRRYTGGHEEVDELALTSLSSLLLSSFSLFPPHCSFWSFKNFVFETGNDRQQHACLARSTSQRACLAWRAWVHLSACRRLPVSSMRALPGVPVKETYSTRLGALRCHYVIYFLQLF